MKLTKKRKEIRKEAKALVRQDRAREKQAGIERRAKSKGLSAADRWKLWIEERQSDRQVIKERKNRIKTLTGAERKEQKLLVKKYNRKRYRARRWLIFAAVVATLILVVNIAAIAMYSSQESPEILQAKEASRAMAREVAGEGFVLLKNEDELLPLAGNRVCVFGASSIEPAFGGGASGAINANYATGFYESLAMAGIEYDPGLYNVYGNFVKSGRISTSAYTPPKRPPIQDIFLPNVFSMFKGRPKELDANEIPATIIEDARAFTNTAVVVLARKGMESILPGYSDVHPQAFKLSTEEKSMVEVACANFENVVVILNISNAIELNWVDDPAYSSIKAVLFVGLPGEVGFESVANVLTGKINPSGRLADTFARDIMATTPAASNTGNYLYVDESGMDTGRRFVKYDESIYVGYRYFETRYGGDEAMYDSVVQYPFGYGLSYTTFEQSIASVSAYDAGSGYTVEVKVTNTGDVPGKEVVQLYSTPPYTEGGIEKSRKNLIAFAKTGLLAPGEAEMVTLRFGYSELASYDSSDAVQAWVVEDGTYVITLGKNAHDAWATYELEIIGVAKDDIPGNENIRNLFAQAGQGLNLMTRADFAGTYPVMMEQGTTAVIPDGLIEADMPDFQSPDNFDRSSVRHSQTYAKTIMLTDLIGKDYGDPIWQQFVEQFTVEEMLKIVGEAGYQILPVERLGLPYIGTCDGPASIKEMFGTKSTIAYPSANLVASSWNVDLHEEMVAHMAREAKLYDIYVWYAPAVNTHRSPLGARNFEYYSEDPLLAGKMGAAATKGAQKNGVIVTVKHFALNEQETNRAAYGVYTWSSEQAMREIYLKTFEIIIKEGDAYGVMSSLNRVGSLWAGDNSALLNDLLRGEWGFHGFVTTDATTNQVGGYIRADESLAGGNDAMLSLLSEARSSSELQKAYEAEPAYMTYLLQKAMHNICYAVLHTEIVGG